MGMQHSHLVDKLVVVNSPHPASFERELKKGRQLLRSWYIFFFQLPLLPEASMRSTLRRSLPNSAQVPGAFPEEALDVYENAISQPGAATAMINYYRAVFRNALAARTLVRSITCPTLLLWGMQDFALVPELTEGLEEWVPNLCLERIQDCGHWVPEEKPGVVADALLDFLLR
jgi:pimeloyl-ACP methyl ester carboxylesterase